MAALTLTPVTPATTDAAGAWHTEARAHPVRLFFLLAYAISWACWTPAVVTDGPVTEALVFVGVWGPAAAAAIVTRLRGDSVAAWFRGLFRWRVAGRWYVFALTLPIAMIAAVSIPFVALGHELDGSLLGGRLAAYVPMLVFLTLLGGGNEELGWRGFALPELLERHSPLRASSTLGSLWALWHLPLLGTSDDLSHGLSGLELTIVLTATVVNIVGLAFIYTFLYRHSRSALLAILLHGSFNAANGTLVLRDEIEGSAYAAMQYSITATTLLIVAGLLFATNGHLGPVDDQRPDASRASLWRHRTWGNRRLGVAIAVGFAATWGVLAGSWTPRGPLTSAEAIWSIALSLCVGAVAGIVLRSRWAMLAAPATFAVVFELTRLDADGPSVDGLHLTTYGMIALATGRGFHALLALVPMLLGAAVGAGIARSLRPVRVVGSRGRIVRRGVTVLTSVALVALIVGLARPARTDPIVDADGEPVPGSIAELTTIDVNGHDLGLMIRGHSVDNPVLLFLAGGPGGSELGAMRRHLPELEEHFTVVTWDQRGAGRSYRELAPADTLTLDGVVDDTLAVTDHLRERFGQDEIYLLGQSWGSTLGVLAVQQRPDAYVAFIGVGQMVSQLETDRIFYADTLDWARSTGRDDLVDDLESIGPPPYDSIFPYETALSHEHEVYPYDHAPNAEGEGGFSENLFVEEYALIDQVHALGAFMDTFAVLYPQLQEIDFRETATEFDVPMFFVQGAHEAEGRAHPFDDWYPMIEAPVKDLVVFDTSGHRPLFEQPDEFVDHMVESVLAGTTGG